MRALSCWFQHSVTSHLMRARHLIALDAGSLRLRAFPSLALFENLRSFFIHRFRFGVVDLSDTVLTHLSLVDVTLHHLILPSSLTILNTSHCCFTKFTVPDDSVLESLQLAHHRGAMPSFFPLSLVTLVAFKDAAWDQFLDMRNMTLPPVTSLVLEGCCEMDTPECPDVLALTSARDIAVCVERLEPIDLSLLQCESFIKLPSEFCAHPFTRVLPCPRVKYLGFPHWPVLDHSLAGFSCLTTLFLRVGWFGCPVNIEWPPHLHTLVIDFWSVDAYLSQQVAQPVHICTGWDKLKLPSSLRRLFVFGATWNPKHCRTELPPLEELYIQHRDPLVPVHKWLSSSLASAWVSGLSSSQHIPALFPHLTSALTAFFN